MNSTLLLVTDFRALRKRLGLTQAELASILETTRQTICEQERGRTPISRERMLAMLYLAEHPVELAISLGRDEIVGTIDPRELDLKPGDTFTVRLTGPTSS